MSTRRQFLRTATVGAAAAATLPNLLRAASPEKAPAPPPEPVPPLSPLLDWHSHFVSPSEIRLLEQRTSAPRVHRDAAGNTTLERTTTVSGLGSTGPFEPSNIEARLKHLDAVGVRKQLLSVMIPLGYDASLSPEEIKPILRAHNDDLAAVVRKYPDRFYGVAALPSSDPAWAAQELERAHKELGLIGGVLPLNAFTTLAGARSLAPVFQVGQKYRSHFFVHRGPAHPSVPGQPALTIPEDTDYARWGLINNHHLTAGAITLGLTDFLDPYPDVTVQIVMLAGFLPYYFDTLVASAQRAGVKDPVERLRRLYIDFGAAARDGKWAALATRTLGADRILFGTDYGVNGGTRGDIAPTLATINAVLTAEDRRLIYVENTRALLKAKGLA